MYLARWLVPSMAILWAMACHGLVTDTPTDEMADAASIQDATPPNEDSPSSEHSADSAHDAAAPVPWELDVTDYDQHCDYNYQCRAVQQGPCRDCMCYDAAVNNRAVDRYYEDFNAEIVRTSCQPKYGEGQQECSGTCDDTRIGLCVGGLCVVGDNRKLDATKYDHACTTVDDCVGVSEALCGDGPGCTTAIAKSALAQFEADRAAAPVCGTPVPWQPASCGDNLRCELGLCRLVFTEVP